MTDDFEPAADQCLRLLNLMEDIAAASEDAPLVFDIMEMKALLGYPTTRQSIPPN